MFARRRESSQRAAKTKSTGGKTTPRRWLALICAALVLGAVTAGLSEPRQNPHGNQDQCITCHTTDTGGLKADPVTGHPNLRQDLESICKSCHHLEEPGHQMGVTPKRKIDPVLPLDAQGRVECWTCHFTHGENPYGEYLRVDNRRGGLCLKCHTFSELP